ncbi:hypothetical protein VC83_01261 [Pseudogymnoascus destructans]|uniref:Uncharacterized protein n=1 Tax=Pseudogymnoascus destructans TaxID=655981 RepID=A0A177AN79_9PEZI|nr:uncharacterized protein VC83_01261 [Pseudogymnoascus destructans]OAF62733.1 hypothetical protein VC83_01261 [Pseudogymnoascus destructans]
MYVCFDEGCMRPHRKWTREGYARFLREVMKVQSDEEVVRWADQEFGDGAGLGSLDDMEAALSGRTQSYGAALGSLDDMQAAFGSHTRGYRAMLRDLYDMEAALGSRTQGYGAGLGSLDDIEAALGGRTGDGAASRSLDDMEATLRMRARGGSGGLYGEEGFTGEGAQGGEHYTEFDGRLDWDIRNEIIHLTKK